MSEANGSLPVANPTTSTSALTDLTLAVRMEGVPEQEVFLQHGLSIGRNPSNTICVNEPEVERIHAMVARQADGSMLLECTEAHLRIVLGDGSEVYSLVLRPGATFKVGKATIRCLKRETKPTLLMTENPWEVRCPRCYGVIADLPHQEHTCPYCQLELQYFVSHHSVHAADEPQSAAQDQTPDEPEFSGWLPRHVGPYKIRAFVAQGGMGIILRGLHTEADLPAAVKLLKSDPAEDPSWRARFMAEIDTLKTLRHPNVVHLQDSGKEDQLLWLAMDWIEGQALTKVVANYRAAGKEFPIDELRQIMAQVVTGLKYLHDKQLIHRDLKPSNVLMATDGLVKLVDFGIAKGAGAQTGVTSQLTQTGMVAGTESYMSPEQAEGRSVTPASDIYSLGVLWYELTTGRRPVGSFAAPHVARVDCPISWSHTITGCMATDPRARPALERILQVLMTNQAEPPPLPAKRNRGPAGGMPPAIPPGAPRAHAPPATPPGGHRAQSPATPPGGNPMQPMLTPPGGRPVQSPQPPGSHPTQPARPAAMAPAEAEQMATQVRPAHRPAHGMEQGSGHGAVTPPGSDRAAVSQLATQVTPARGPQPPPPPPSRTSMPAAGGAAQEYAPNPYAGAGARGFVNAPGEHLPQGSSGGSQHFVPKGGPAGKPMAIAAIVGLVAIVGIILLVRGCSGTTTNVTPTPGTGAGVTPTEPTQPVNPLTKLRPMPKVETDDDDPRQKTIVNSPKIPSYTYDPYKVTDFYAMKPRFDDAIRSGNPDRVDAALAEMSTLASERKNTLAMLYLAQFYGARQSGQYYDRNRGLMWAHMARLEGDPNAMPIINSINAQKTMSP